MDGTVNKFKKAGIRTIETVFRLDEGSVGPAEAAIGLRISKDLQCLRGEPFDIKEVPEQPRLTVPNDFADGRHV